MKGTLQLDEVIVEPATPQSLTADRRPTVLVDLKLEHDLHHLPVMPSPSQRAGTASRGDR
jgi:hypothetical protein